MRVSLFSYVMDALIATSFFMTNNSKGIAFCLAWIVFRCFYWASKLLEIHHFSNESKNKIKIQLLQVVGSVILVAVALFFFMHGMNKLKSSI